MNKSSEQVESTRTTEEFLEFCNEPKTKGEIQEFMKLSSRSYFVYNVLNPLLESGKLVMTIPEKPNSSKQKYVRKQ